MLRMSEWFTSLLWVGVWCTDAGSGARNVAANQKGRSEGAGEGDEDGKALGLDSVAAEC